MKRVTLLFLLLMMCSSCTALPAEERAYAVALCVERTDTSWRVYGRIPTYQTGGGYLTIKGEGETLAAALVDMDASAPMHVHLSQLRLLVLEKRLVENGELSTVLNTFSDRTDMRPGCAVAMTRATAKKVTDTLQPAAGTRLSKAVDVLLDTRIEQGAIIPATLADVLRMGERQSPVLMLLTVEDKEINLSGGIPINAAMQPGTSFSPMETALLSLLLGHAKTLRLSLPGGSAQVRDAAARISLGEDMHSASVTLTLRTTASSYTTEGLEQMLADACLSLLERLSAEGCDVLGLGRKAIMKMHDMSQWHDLDWSGLYKGINWTVSVKVNGPA